MDAASSTDAIDPVGFIAALPEPRRAEVERLDQLIREVAPELGAPTIQSGMLAYGPYHYRYASGREGDWYLIGLASRKAYVSLYVSAVNAAGHLAESYRDRLPRADIGRSCVRIKRLSDVDLGVVADLIRAAVAAGPPANPA